MSTNSTILNPPIPTSLDGLLERYLYLLDRYTKLKEQLSKDLSSGFLSLAQANFNAPSHVRCYGQDLYDERMKAVLRIDIGQSLRGTIPTFKPVSLPITKAIQTSNFNLSRSTPPFPRLKEILPQLPTPEATPEPDIPSTSPTQSSSSQKDPTLKVQSESSAPTATSTAAFSDLILPIAQSSLPNSSRKPDHHTEPSTSEAMHDPLRQFGILVPPALRAAQGSFSAAVKDGVLDLINVSREMEGVEAGIRVAREQQHQKKKMDDEEGD